MAVPSDTTAGDLRGLARWVWLGLLVLAPLTLWWPSLPGWAALLAASLGLWVLWLAWRTTAGRVDVPGHWLQLVLTGLLVLSIVHVTRSGLGNGQSASRLVRGRMDATYLIHIALLMLWVLLSQDLVGRLRPWAWTAWALAAAAGAVAALLPVRPQGHAMLACMGWSGVALLLGAPGGRWMLRGAAAVALGAALSVLARHVLPVVAVTGGAVIVIMALLARPWRRSMRLVLAGAGLALLAAGLWHVSRAGALPWPSRLPRTPADWVGRGEDALGPVHGWSHGAVFLAGTFGWAGLLWAGLWLTGGTLATLLRTARQGRSMGRFDPGALAALAAAVLAGVAMLAPGGLFCPAVNVLFAATWAVLPVRLGLPVARRSGWRVLAVMLAVAAVAGLTYHAGLLVWAARLYRMDDVALHLAAGWLLAQVLLWLLGRRGWGGALAVVLSLVAAAGAEWGQRHFSTRSVQWEDFFAHAIGSAGAALVWLLCRGALWGESSELPPRGAAAPRSYDA